MDSSFVSSGLNRHRPHNNYIAKGAFLVLSLLGSTTDTTVIGTRK